MTWLQTATGVAFDLVDPTPDMVRPEDIAHSLAGQCRYAGHTSRHYSVAEHCVLMHDWLHRANMPRAARVALVHDAAEAYLPDIQSPWKALIPGWREQEQRIEAVVSEALGTPLHSPIVKVADLRILLDERAALLVEPPQSWGPVEDMRPLGVMIRCWSRDRAREEWMRRWAREVQP